MKSSEMTPEIRRALAASYEANGACTNFQAALGMIFGAIEAFREDFLKPACHPIHVVIVTDGSDTAGNSTESLQTLIQDRIEGQAVVVSTIAVGLHVNHATVEALTVDTKGYYGYAPEVDALPLCMAEAMEPFTLSTVPFMLRVRDSRTKLDASVAYELPDTFHGMLHPGNCCAQLDVSAGAKASAGKHVAATVGLVDAGEEWRPHAPTNLAIQFVEDQEGYDYWMCNEYARPALFAQLRSDDWFHQECLDLLASELTKDTGIKGAIEALRAYIQKRSSPDPAPDPASDPASAPDKSDKPAPSAAAIARVELMLKRTEEKAAMIAASGNPDAGIYNANSALMFARATSSRSATMPCYITQGGATQSAPGC